LGFIGFEPGIFGAVLGGFGAGAGAGKRFICREGGCFGAEWLVFVIG
jgi:hypothetical protein